MAAAAASMMAPVYDENHLVKKEITQLVPSKLGSIPDSRPAAAFQPEFDTPKTAEVAVCAMAKLSTKMEAMSQRMAKAHSLKAHSQDIAAYHREMRAIQAELIRAEIELQADLAAEGLHAEVPHHHHPNRGHHKDGAHGHDHHHHKRVFQEETNHVDAENHIVESGSDSDDEEALVQTHFEDLKHVHVHDELHEHDVNEPFRHHHELHADSHVFEGLELAPLSQVRYLPTLPSRFALFCSHFARLLTEPALPDHVPSRKSPSQSSRCLVSPISSLTDGL